MTVNPCHRQLIGLSIVFISFPIIITATSSLKGKNLIILPTQFKKYMETKVNSSGYVIETNGSVPEMLSWLSDRFQFDYSFVPSVTTLVTDDTPTQRGRLSYLKNNEADMVVGAIVMTPQRFQQADFPMPWLWTSLGVVAPFPKSTTSVSTLLNPWKFEVWAGVLLALPIFIMCLFGLDKCYSVFSQKRYDQQQLQNARDSSFDSIFIYIFEVFLSQGGYLRNGIMVSPIRLAMAAWCLACFILVQSYSCNLTSFLTIPQYDKPIINSIYDVPKVKNLRIVTDRGLAPDVLLSTADFGVFKHLGAMLENSPELRCNTTEQCVDRVKSGSHVYVAVVSYLDMAIQADYEKNGVCNMILLKNRFLNSFVGFAVVKKSVYMEEFNRGMIEMRDYGLAQHWNKKYIVPQKELCHQENRNRQRRANKSRLSLTNFASAFFLLFLGHTLSFLVFLVENIIRHIIT